MELLDGATLQRIVAVDGAQPAGRVVRILTMVCGALTEAHAIGLIHRDIKPANIMLCTQGGERDVVKLLDFGLVKEFEVDRDVKLTGASIDRRHAAVHGSGVHPRAGLGRRPHRHLRRSGRSPTTCSRAVDVFDGKSIVEVCSQHLHQEPEPLSARGIAIPAELEAVVLACLNKDPERRPQSAARAPAPARSVPGRALGRAQSAGLVARVQRRTSIASRGTVRATSGPSPLMERAGPETRRALRLIRESKLERVQRVGGGVPWHVGLVVDHGL